MSKDLLNKRKVNTEVEIEEYGETTFAKLFIDDGYPNTYYLNEKEFTRLWSQINRVESKIINKMVNKK